MSFFLHLDNSRYSFFKNLCEKSTPTPAPRGLTLASSPPNSVDIGYWEAEGLFSFSFFHKKNLCEKYCRVFSEFFHFFDLCD